MPQSSVDNKQQLGALSLSLGALQVLGGIAVIALQFPRLLYGPALLGGIVSTIIGVYCITHALAYLKGEESQLYWILAAWIFALSVTLVAVKIFILQVVLVAVTGYIIYEIIQLMQEE